MTWDPTKPAGSQKIRLSDEEIRANWAALQDALAREHTFPGVLGSTAGKHTPLIALLQKQTFTAAAAAGTVDAVTASFDPAIAALADYLLVCVIAAGANTSTTPTFAPDGLAAKTIVKNNNQPLVAGDIPGANYPLYLLYISSLDKWILLNPKVSFAGHVVQVVQNSTNTPGSTSTIIPYDSSKPQKTEGAEVLTVAITPKVATNRLVVKWVLPCTVAAGYMISALFLDDNADALAAMMSCSEGPQRLSGHVGYYSQITGGIAEMTFKLRCGPNSGTGYWCQNDSGVNLGSLLTASLKIYEVQVG